MPVFKLTFFICIAVALFACSSHMSQSGQASTVIEFHYGGYDDTVFALISGRIYEPDDADSLIALKDVQIKSEQNNKVVTTNSSGAFLIGLGRGNFSLLITKKGYQSVRITNFISNPDQLSDTKIRLVKGKGLSTFEIPNP
jgi:hypothetical protein